MLSKFSQTYLVMGQFFSLKTYFGKAVHSYKQIYSEVVLFLSQKINSRLVLREVCSLLLVRMRGERGWQLGEEELALKQTKDQLEYGDRTPVLFLSPWKNRFKKHQKSKGTEKYTFVQIHIDPCLSLIGSRSCLGFITIHLNSFFTYSPFPKVDDFLQNLLNFPQACIRMLKKFLPIGKKLSILWNIEKFSLPHLEPNMPPENKDLSYPKKLWT